MIVWEPLRTLVGQTVLDGAAYEDEFTMPSELWYNCGNHRQGTAILEFRSVWAADLDELTFRLITMDHFGDPGPYDNRTGQAGIGTVLWEGTKTAAGSQNKLASRYTHKIDFLEDGSMYVDGDTVNEYGRLQKYLLWQVLAEDAAAVTDWAMMFRITVQLRA